MKNIYWISTHTVGQNNASEEAKIKTMWLQDKDMQLGVGGSNIPSSLLLEIKQLIFNTASNWVWSKIDHLKHKEEWPKETIFF